MIDFPENHNDYTYKSGPDEFFKVFIEGLQPGRILLPAEGDGHNAIFAAARGWEVNIFDFSLNARRKALELWHKEGISLDYFVADIEFHELEEEMYDVIALIHVHFQPHNRSYIHKKLVSSLKTGGFFLVEAYGMENSADKTGSHPAREVLYDLKDMQSDFSGLEIETLYKTETDVVNKGAGLSPATIIRMIALKP